MRRNYTETRSYLLKPENLQKTLVKIEHARSETWRNGWSTTQLEAKYKKTNREFHQIKEEIKEKIERISDERLRIVLVKRYLELKSGAEIMRITGWSEKFVKHLHERALMNMEIILLEDGVLSFVDPEADMRAEYQDGFNRGESEGYKNGYECGYEDGYEEGYERGEQGLPYDKDEDDYEDEDDDDDEDCYDEDYESYDGEEDD